MHAPCAHRKGSTNNLCYSASFGRITPSLPLVPSLLMSANAFRRQTDYQKALFLYLHISLHLQFFLWHSWQRAGAPFGPFCTNLAPAAGAMPSLGASQHPKMRSGGCSGGDLLHNFQTRLSGRLTPPSCGHFLGAASPLAGGVPLPPSGRSLLGTAAPPPPGSEAKTLAETPPRSQICKSPLHQHVMGGEGGELRGRKGVWGPCGCRGAWVGKVPLLQKGPGILGVGTEPGSFPGCPGTG